MPKDYAQFYVAPSPHLLRRRRWMLSCLIAFLLLGVGWMAYSWVGHRASVAKHAEAGPHRLSQKNTQHLQKAPVTPVADPLPEFDFYTLLPQESVHQDVRPIQSKPAAATPGVYTLQLASFRKKQDAQRWSVRLDLLGLDAHIRLVRSQGQAWYRVLVGPYASKEAALRAQKHLRQKHINSILVPPRRRS